MTDKSVEQKPSETALFAALRRTIAHKEYKNEAFGPDHLAECFLPAHYRFFLRFEKIRASTKQKLARFLPGMNEYMIARTAWFDRLFVKALNAQTPQIVLLGAGYDSRAYRFAKINCGSTIFELDIATTQNRKKKCLKAARIDIPQQVQFVPINFNTEPLRDVLKNAGYSYREKTLFAWEGVSYYLDAPSVEATLEFASRCAAADSAIAFDYAIPLTAENSGRYYGAKEFAQTMKAEHAGEQMKFAVEAGQIESFLEQRGLRMIDHLDNKAIERACLLDESGASIGPITGHFRFVIASPRR